jgi:hypothetical protein
MARKRSSSQGDSYRGYRVSVRLVRDDFSDYEPVRSLTGITSEDGTQCPLFRITMKILIGDWLESTQLKDSALRSIRASGFTESQRCLLIN